MKRRVLCLYLPQWPIQRALGGLRSERQGRKDAGGGRGEVVLVLHARDPRRGEVVAAASGAARRAGVRVGMPLAEAGALLRRVGQACGVGQACRVGQAHPAIAGPPRDVVGGAPDPTIAPHDFQADLAELARLAERCERFSPIVGWETVQGSRSKLPSQNLGPATLDFGPPTGPDCLFLDITGIGVLFGGEEQLAAELVGQVKQWGYEARVAIADTIGAAWGAASQESGGRSQESGGWTQLDVRDDVQEPSLRACPLAALRLPQDTVNLLNQLGVQQVAELLALPRESLRARFGERLILRIDQFLGTAQETIVAHRPPPQFIAEWVLEYPTERREVIERIVEELVRRIARSLAERREGVLRLVCRLDCAPGQPLFLTIGLFRPSAEAAHLGELMRLQLERATLRGALGRVRLEAVITARLENRQGFLFAGDEQRAAGQLAQLIDRCNSRLGARAVLQPELTADPLPEKAVRYRVGGRGQGAGGRGWGRGGIERDRQLGLLAPRSAYRVPRLPLLRPLAVYSPPVPLPAVSIAPDGPPVWFDLAGERHQVAHHTGPERIETGWWRGQSVRRDYWRVETTTGERFWLFRHLENGQWQLQGAYA